MTKEEIQKEKSELERMTRKGFDFTCEYDITKRNWLGKKKVEHKVEHFYIEEPTLGTLDRMSNAMMEIESVVDFDKEDSLKRATEMAARYTRTVCRVIAYAVIGSEYIRMIKKDGHVCSVVAEERVNELVEVFLHCLKPSDMTEIVMYVMAVRNMQDFITSTMLMSAGRTSRPDMVEQRD